MRFVPTSVSLMFLSLRKAIRGGSGVATGGMPPPLLPKYGPRDSSKIEQQMAGYRFGKNVSEKWLDEQPQFKAISECRQKKFSEAEIQNKRSRKVALKTVRQTLVWCGRREVFERIWSKYGIRGCILRQIKGVSFKKFFLAF